MRTLIIGGTGLISTAITRLLVERGDEVTVYNRGQREAPVPAGVKRILGDRKSYASFERQMAEAGPFDCVIDMVCFLPEEAESDVRAFSRRVGQLIFCSTVDVYGKPARGYPYREDEPRRALGTYGINKVRCERVFEAAHERGDLAVTLIRPAHTYGESGSILHTLGWDTYSIDRIRQGLPIIVHGHGQSLWVSCHIDDVGPAFVAASGNPKTFGKAYHVTGEEWQTWNQYHEGVADALGAPRPTLIHIPTDLLSKAAPKQASVCAINFQFDNIFDNAAAHADLEVQSPGPGVEGVRRPVAWLDEHGRIQDSTQYPFYDRIIAAWERLGEQFVGALSHEGESA